MLRRSANPHPRREAAEPPLPVLPTEPCDECGSTIERLPLSGRNLCGYCDVEASQQAHGMGRQRPGWRW